VPSGCSSPKNGPEGDRWIQFNGVRHQVPKGVVFRFIRYMWARDSATYSELSGGGPHEYAEAVFDSLNLASTVKSRVGDVNRELLRIGIPWKLTANGRAEMVSKVPR
jgi:hypothetical protein